MRPKTIITHQHLWPPRNDSSYPNIDLTAPCSSSSHCSELDEHGNETFIMADKSPTGDHRRNFPTYVKADGSFLFGDSGRHTRMLTDIINSCWTTSSHWNVHCSSHWPHNVDNHVLSIWLLERMVLHKFETDALWLKRVEIAGKLIARVTFELRSNAILQCNVRCAVDEHECTLYIDRLTFLSPPPHQRGNMCAAVRCTNSWHKCMMM